MKEIFERYKESHSKLYNYVIGILKPNSFIYGNEFKEDYSLIKYNHQDGFDPYDAGTYNSLLFKERDRAPIKVSINNPNFLLNGNFLTILCEDVTFNQGHTSVCSKSFVIDITTDKLVSARYEIEKTF